MKKELFIGLSFLVLIIQGACQENGNPNLMEFYWEQTGCADPWGGNSQTPNDELSKMVNNYLKDHLYRNAKVSSIKNDGLTQLCMACACTTGRRIYVSAPFSQKEKMLDLGFTENK